MDDQIKFRIIGTYEALKKAVENIGYKWDFEKSEYAKKNPEIAPSMREVEIQDVRLDLDIFEESSRSHRFSRLGNGKLRISFGSCGKKRSFPEPKAGFDFGKIALAVDSYVKEVLADRNAYAENSAKRIRAQGIANTINKEIGLSSHLLQAKVGRNGEIKVFIEIPTSEELARKILSAVKAVLKEEGKIQWLSE